MYFEQVLFRITDTSMTDPDDDIYGGIAAFEGNNVLQYVICGCCGGVFEPDSIEILEQYTRWVNLSDEIIGS